MKTRDDFARERAAHAEPVRITISTKVPSKWRFVDLETGDVWKWEQDPEIAEYRGKFTRAIDTIVESGPWAIVHHTTPPRIPEEVPKCPHGRQAAICAECFP